MNRARETALRVPRIALLLPLLAALSISLTASAWASAVDVRVVSDRKGVLSLYPVGANGERGTYPAYLEAERHFLKYEWRDTLCRKGILDCRTSRNRFWDDDAEYAPYPPGGEPRVLRVGDELRTDTCRWQTGTESDRMKLQDADGPPPRRAVSSRARP